MAKTDNLIKKFPWFTIDRYQKIKNMTCLEFIFQIYIRKKLLAIAKKHKPDQQVDPLLTEWFKVISSINGLQVAQNALTIGSDAQILGLDCTEELNYSRAAYRESTIRKFINELNCDSSGSHLRSLVPQAVLDRTVDGYLRYLDGTREVTPLTIEDLSDLTFEFGSKGFSKNLKLTVHEHGQKILCFNKSEVINFTLSTGSASLYLNHISPAIDLRGGSMSDSVLVRINLREGTNESILSSLSSLLPAWRSDLEIPEHESEDISSPESNFKKALSYKIIPLLDLLISNYVINKISHFEICSLLYSGQDVTEERLRKTYLKFINDKFIEKQYIEWVDYLRKSGIGHKKVKDAF